MKFGQSPRHAQTLCHKSPCRPVLHSWGIDTSAEIEGADIADLSGLRQVHHRQARDLARDAGDVPTKIAIADCLEVQKIDRQFAARVAANS